MAQKRKKYKKWISWVILLALLIIAAVVVYMVWDNYFNDKKDNKEQETAQADGKTNEDNNASKSDGEEIKKKIDQYDGEDPNKADTLSGAVTYAGVNNGVLMVRVNIDQYLESGECRLTLARGGATIYSSIAEIIGGPSTASCAGFDVPVSELGGGAVEININLNSGERSGTIHGEANL